MNPVSTIDLREWRAGGTRADEVAAVVDTGLQRAGFLLVTGHDVPPRLAVDVRAAARRFFALPRSVKERYAVSVGGRGWMPPGVEANGASEGTETPPDMKESLSFGAQTFTGDPDVDRQWFPPNVWPEEVTELRTLVEDHFMRMTTLADELLAVCATALGQPAATFASMTDRATWSWNLNHYPPVSVVGAPEPGQYRIGPHTDFGMVTILDREPGSGGLQIHTDDGGWQDAPFDPDALTVNVGDLLAYWSGHRWRSGRHQVLPPQPDSPEEDLVSLVFFYDLDHDAVVTPLQPPIGLGEVTEPVISGVHLQAKIDSITVG